MTVTGEQIAQLRRMVNEPGSSRYNDARLVTIIDANTENLNQAAAEIWQEKAASYAELTDVQEGGSLRKMSGLHTQALKMASFYTTSDVPDPGDAAVLGRSSRTRAIDRV